MGLAAGSRDHHSVVGRWGRRQPQGRLHSRRLSEPAESRQGRGDLQVGLRKACAAGHDQRRQLLRHLLQGLQQGLRETQGRRARRKLRRDHGHHGLLQIDVHGAKSEGDLVGPDEARRRQAPGARGLDLQARGGRGRREGAGRPARVEGHRGSVVGRDQQDLFNKGSRQGPVDHEGEAQALQRSSKLLWRRLRPRREIPDHP
mmetsp:Transcript_3281/g.10031  ORF Transcript_3281/g.10031 Transcript_3281/m.10031 type:complete len:202 (-) Transcript_3281:1912-2517(-)